MIKSCLSNIYLKMQPFLKILEEKMLLNEFNYTHKTQEILSHQQKQRKGITNTHTQTHTCISSSIIINITNNKKITRINSHCSLIYLNKNELNSPVRRYILTEWIKEIETCKQIILIATKVSTCLSKVHIPNTQGSWRQFPEYSMGTYPH